MLRVLVLLALLAVGFGGGWTLRERLAGAPAARVITRTITRIEKQGEATAQVAQQVQAQVDHAQSDTRTLIKEIPYAVPAGPDSDPVLSHGWVRIHDAAALGLPAGGPDAQAPGEPDYAPPGIVSSQALKTIVENYGACREVRAVAAGWQDWYAKVSADPPH